MSMHVSRPNFGILRDSGHWIFIISEPYPKREDQRCYKLVLTVAEEPKGDVSTFEAMQLEVAIEAGMSTRYQLTEGKLLEFTCQQQAQAMNIKSLETIAGTEQSRR